MATPTQIRLGIFLVSIALGAAYWSLRSSAPQAWPAFGVHAANNASHSGNPTIAGVVKMPDGTVRPATVDLLRANDAAPPTRTGPPGPHRFQTSTTDARGEFGFWRVPPSEYLVVARSEDPAAADGVARHFWASAAISVAGNPAPLSLTLREGASLSGRITATALAGSPPPDLAHVSLVLLPADAAARVTAVIGYPHAVPSRDGSFAIEDVAPGQYMLQYMVEGPWAIDAAAVDGQDWLDLPITLAPGAHSIGALVALTDRPGGVSGDARLPDGRPAAFQLVFVYDAVPSHRLTPRRAQATRTDAQGRFHVGGLPSGDYLVALAGVNEDPLAWYTEPFFEKIAAGAKHVMVAPGPPRDLRLTAR